MKDTKFPPAKLLSGKICRVVVRTQALTPDNLETLAEMSIISGNFPLHRLVLTLLCGTFELSLLEFRTSSAELPQKIYDDVILQQELGSRSRSGSAEIPKLAWDRAK